ncbi:MAG TPA: metallophosphoesterase [Firmicutes bacterium]|nr:metallophosphoesterase [Bacillota bacterium]
MKIGVLSDIHGNLQALEAVINELKAQGIEEYIIAGDLVSDCGQPNEVVEYVKRLNPNVIKGNREEYVESYLAGKRSNWDKYDQMGSVVWTANTLTDENREYLKQLPNFKKLDCGDKGVVTVVHGSPFKTSQLVFEQDLTLLASCVDKVKSEVLIMAHTHTPFSLMVEGTLVVNPGAVGVHFNQDYGAEYAILHYEEGRFVASHHVAKYDLKAVKQNMIANGLYEHAPVWCELIYASLVEGFNHSVTFLQSCQDLVNEDGFVPNEIFSTSFEKWLNLQGMGDDK